MPIDVSSLPRFVDPSPNGEWEAESLGAFPPIWMRVYRVDGSAEWRYSYVGPEWSEVRFKPVHWSIDGRYLYFTLFPFTLLPRIDGELVYIAGSGLWQLALEDGELAQVLPGEGQLWDFSISSDSTSLAYIQKSSDAIWIAVRDLRRGKEQRNRLSWEPAQAGSITWSPDGSSLVLLLTRGFSWQDHRTRLILFDAISHSWRTVLAEKPGLYLRLSWINDHTIYFEDRDLTAWVVDLTTGKVSPTPSAFEPASG